MRTTYFSAIYLAGIALSDAVLLLCCMTHGIQRTLPVEWITDVLKETKVDASGKPRPIGLIFVNFWTFGTGKEQQTI